MKKTAVLTLLLLLFACPAFGEDGMVYEAEEAALKGGNKIVRDAAASQGAAVGSFERDEDTLAFLIKTPADGAYDLVFTCKGIGGGKTNLVWVDGAQAGDFTCSGIVYEDAALRGVMLTEGEHQVTVGKSWGWIYLDRLTVTPSRTVDESVYQVAPGLINPDAGAEALALYDTLRGYYGKAILSGQFCSQGADGPEMKAIYDLTGKYPAILGLDMMDYSPARAALGARSDAVERAVKYHAMGGIITFCWHWNAPTATLKEGKDANGNPRWWGGFYTDNTTFDFSRALSGENPEEKAALEKDIAAIAGKLKELESQGVPVLWRPLHEASGGWFWWGAQGPEAYKQLWVYLYDQLTNVYHCNNLIWVWNGQHPDWYPGDAYVDIIGEDIYASPHQYGSQQSKFMALTEYSSAPRIIALTENGVVPDPEACVQSGALWGWFCTWNGSFVVNGSRISSEYTEAEQLKRVYDSEYVITLDELP